MPHYGYPCRSIRRIFRRLFPEVEIGQGRVSRSIILEQKSAGFPLQVPARPIWTGARADLLKCEAPRQCNQLCAGYGVKSTLFIFFLVVAQAQTDYEAASRLQQVGQHPKGPRQNCAVTVVVAGGFQDVSRIRQG